MGTWIKQRARDGHEAAAWRADPSGDSKGGVILIQEIFGVNAHIRAVAGRLAAAGYTVLAPSLFDRSAPEVQLGYGPEGIGKGVELMKQASLEDAMLDVEASRVLLAKSGPVGVMGFCWGGLVTWLAATRVDGLSAAVAYYPGGIGNFIGEDPRCPTLLHFAEHDDHIPVSDAKKVAATYPGKATVHIYPAQHGFNCDERPSFEATSAASAWEKTTTFLQEKLRKIKSDHAK